MLFGVKKEDSQQQLDNLDLWEEEKIKNVELLQSRFGKQESPVYRMGFRWTESPSIKEEIFKDPEYVKKALLSEGVEKYAYQLEFGEKTKKLHYQGCFSIKGKRRPKELAKVLNKKLLGIEVMMAHDWKALEAYCVKEETRIAGPWSFPQVYYGQDLNEIKLNPYKWQKEILNIVETIPDRRKIYWVFDPKGSTGKSMLTKYLVYFKKFGLLAFENSRDVLFAAKEQRAPGYILDMTRAVPKAYDINQIYATMEQIKNGCFFSSKYTSSLVLDSQPHIFIFSNGLPDYSKLSMDRWVTMRIGNKTKTLYYMDLEQIRAFKRDYVFYKEEVYIWIKKYKKENGLGEQVSEEDLVLYGWPYKPSENLLEKYGD